MRHLAWLRAVPESANISRLQDRINEEKSIDMPDIDGFEPIIEYLNELGYAKSGINGVESFSFGDVDDWCRATNACVENWVIILLVHLSRDYAYQANISSGKLCKAPYQMMLDDYDLQALRKRTDKKLKDLF